MPDIDIEISADLKSMIDIPPCVDLRLPRPQPMKIQLPTGGSIRAFADISKGIPNDCSMTFNLLLQLAPLLASMECLVKILKFIKALVDVVPGPPTPQSILKMGQAAADLAPCFLIPTPASIIPFVRDILCLILKVLRCLVGQLRTLLTVMNGISLQLDAARTAGNVELIGTLECAMQNAEISGQHLTASIEPLGVILDLAGPLMGIAGVQPIQLPGLGSQADAQALTQAIQTMQGVIGTIQAVVDALGGCS